MQPEVMRAQKCEIQISRVKNFLSVVFIRYWKSFLQLCNKLILKLVLSFMNRKSSCGYATHFFRHFFRNAWHFTFIFREIEDVASFYRFRYFLKTFSEKLRLF
jgi:hypothetical protein